MTNITANINRVRERLDNAARAAGRDPAAITLLAVSKTQPAASIRAAHAGGLRDFGENYLQEALDKIALLRDLADIRWHFIGPIQSNKTRAIAEHFAWAHGVDRLKIAERLSQQRPPALPPLNVCLQGNIDRAPRKAGVAPEGLPTLAGDARAPPGLPPLNVCLQVNIDGEASKSGVAPEALPALADAVAALPGLRLRGLMAIPAPSDDAAAQRAPFFRLAQQLATLRARLPGLDT